VVRDTDDLIEWGWREIEPGVWRHALGALPDVVARERPCVALRVESLDAFLDAIGLETPIEGAPFAPLRRARLFSGDGASFDAVERNGGVGFAAPNVPERRIRKARLHQQAFRTRRRRLRDDEGGLRETRRVIAAAVGDLGAAWTCDLFMRAEREYWQSRCVAGLLQARRQEMLGLGWSNIDHHGYIASRQHLGQTITIFEDLGYERREVMRTGDWASQVMEHPVLRSSLTVDGDIGEHQSDSHWPDGPLFPLMWHASAGLWVALHGEGLLEGGLHHLACRFDRGAFTRIMNRENVALMAPSSDRSDFYARMSEGEARPVDPRRVDRLQRSEFITAADAETFRFNGALASHLECVERNNGFKGFDAPVKAPLRLR
jgi:hypothetical protein